jgi:hypothetical protein
MDDMHHKATWNEPDRCQQTERNEAERTDKSLTPHENVPDAAHSHLHGTDLASTGAAAVPPAYPNDSHFLHGKPEKRR